jgi:hypothetical protein
MLQRAGEAGGYEGSETLGRLACLSGEGAERSERTLWLSGLGFRAGLFHLGALTRLNEVGLLTRLHTVGAVSGGSILAALLAARVTWPLTGPYEDWEELVAVPMRAIAAGEERAWAIPRRPFPGSAGEAAREEGIARELAGPLGEAGRGVPRFAFGASGLALSGIEAGLGGAMEWRIGDASAPAGYAPGPTAEIAGLRAGLEPVAEPHRALLENHGYLLAEAALRTIPDREWVPAAGVPWPQWLDDERVEEALGDGRRGAGLGLLRRRRGARRKSWERAG